MSDIKGIPGSGSPGGFPVNAEETSDGGVPQFNPAGGKVRSDGIQELLPAVQTTPSPTQGSELKRDLLRALEQASLAGLHPQGLPGFSTPPPAVANPSAGSPGSVGLDTSEPSLRSLFGGGSAPAVGASEPNLQELFGGGNTPASSTPPAPVTSSPNQPNPAAVNFTPTFMQAQNVDIMTGSVTNLNQNYFATQETANWLANTILPQLGFPGATIVSKPAQASGGTFVANQQELWIQLPNGTQINAGELASYYVNNPESQFPGLADSMVKKLIQGDMQGGSV